ncbi:MAG: hypothetical protein WCC65_05950 [Pseudonocardiaceae bacterium]
MTGFMARRLANYVLLRLVATFLACALGSLTSRRSVSVRLFTLGALVGIAAGVLFGVASAIRQYRPSAYAGCASRRRQPRTGGLVFLRPQVRSVRGCLEWAPSRSPGRAIGYVL